MFRLRRCEYPCVDNPAVTAQSWQKTRLLWITLVLLAVFFVVEWSVGLWSRSLSLQADAGHMFSDVAALGISLIASWLAQQPAKGKATFGYRRVEILAALVNGLSLLLIASAIAMEAMQRLHSPNAILGMPMLVVATLGLIINLLNIGLLHPHSHNDLNLRGALLHVISDTVSSISVIFAALVIHLWNWLWADLVVSLVVAILTALSALPLIKESLKILLEYAPETVEPQEVEASLKSFAGVAEVEKLHIWTIGMGQVMLCANLTVDCPIEERDRLLRKLQKHLHRSFGITETSLQLTSVQSQVVKPLHPLFEQSLVAIITTK